MKTLMTSISIFLFASLFSPSQGFANECKYRVLKTHTLGPGARMVLGDTIITENLKYKLVLQCDGNLVFYNRTLDDEVVWSSNTQGKGVTHFDMQVRGNFAAFNGSQVVWHTDTHNKGQSTLSVQNDGNLAIRTEINRNIIWNTLKPHDICFDTTNHENFPTFNAAYACDASHAVRSKRFYYTGAISNAFKQGKYQTASCTKVLATGWVSVATRFSIIPSEVYGLIEQQARVYNNNKLLTSVTHRLHLSTREAKAKSYNYYCYTLRRIEQKHAVKMKRRSKDSKPPIRIKLEERLYYTRKGISRIKKRNYRNQHRSTKKHRSTTKHGTTKKSKYYVAYGPRCTKNDGGAKFMGFGSSCEEAKRRAKEQMRHEKYPCNISNGGARGKFLGWKLVDKCQRR